MANNKINWSVIASKMGFKNIRYMFAKYYIHRNMCVEDIRYLMWLESGIKISSITISNKLRYLGFGTGRDKKDSLAQYFGYDSMNDMLSTEYPKIHSLRKLGDKIGVCPQTVAIWLKQYNIPIFPRGGANNHHGRNYK